MSTLIIIALTNILFISCMMYLMYLSLYDCQHIWDTKTSQNIKLYCTNCNVNVTNQIIETKNYTKNITFDYFLKGFASFKVKNDILFLHNLYWGCFYFFSGIIVWTLVKQLIHFMGIFLFNKKRLLKTTLLGLFCFAHCCVPEL